ASFVWWSRRRAAIVSEHEGIRCLACGHDLQGTPHEQSGGRCPECGADFVMEPSNLMARTIEQGENVTR
ncbi:MAG: hypothetical protein CMJ67_08950, partial [Planctomycetaceae bacterium]|nr:hypothetical protein [Planctomycetaceae bacterium]